MAKQSNTHKRQLSVQLRNGHKPLVIEASTFTTRDGFVEFKSGNRCVALLNGHDVVAIVEDSGK